MLDMDESRALPLEEIRPIRLDSVDEEKRAAAERTRFVALRMMEERKKRANAERTPEAALFAATALVNGLSERVRSMLGETEAAVLEFEKSMENLALVRDNTAPAPVLAGRATFAAAPQNHNAACVCAADVLLEVTRMLDSTISGVENELAAVSAESECVRGVMERVARLRSVFSVRGGDACVANVPPDVPPESGGEAVPSRTSGGTKGSEKSAGKKKANGEEKREKDKKKRSSKKEATRICPEKAEDAKKTVSKDILPRLPAGFRHSFGKGMDRPSLETVNIYRRVLSRRGTRDEDMNDFLYATRLFQEHVKKETGSYWNGLTPREREHEVRKMLRELEDGEKSRR